MNPRESAAPGVLAVAAAMLLRTGLLVTLFVLVAATLGPAEFGTFSAVLAIYGLASPMCGTGIAMALVGRVAAEPATLRETSGAALQAALVSGIALMLPAALLLRILLPQDAPWTLLLSVGLAELVFAPCVEICGRAFQVSGAPFLLPGMLAMLIGLRLCGFAGWWWLTGHGAPLDAEQWGLIYVGASAVASLAALGFLSARRGRPRLGGGGALAMVRAGAPMGLTWTAARANADADKALLARIADTATTGWYTAAYRIVDLVLLPVQALLETSLPRFFASRPDADAVAGREFRRVLAWVAAIGILGAFGLGGLAHGLPWLLGPSYDGAVAMLQALSALPAVAGLRLLLRQTLLGKGQTRSYPVFEATGALTNVALNLLLIPRMGWLGAVVSSYASESLMALLSAIALVRLRRGAPTPTRGSANP
jgi:O-antigen/teichoic acid export membrane protein